MDASSVFSDDGLSDYDVISNPGHRSIESSVADLGALMTASHIYEPAPSQAARERFSTVNITAEEACASVQRFLGPSATKYGAEHKRMRIYVDGIFDQGVDTGVALQLRQAKLSFPSVHLIVGVFSDEDCDFYGFPAVSPHVERCEAIRHCRWVDEVAADAPWRVDDLLLNRRKIDYVAIEEGITVHPKCDRFRLEGYDEMKKLGKIIPLRRTLGLAVARPSSASTPLPPASPTPAETPIPASPEHRPPTPSFTADIYGIGY
ncbi:cholinephosphate cytidylyltransferase [Mycena floridula]|nr:cholinephosphate cytidylyltransferase [Mycena floridula]